MKQKKSLDRTLLVLVGMLLVVGTFAFSSAALGLLARGTVSVTSLAINHILLGIGLGLVALILASRINYRIWKTYAPYLFGASLLATALVFVPGLGIEAGGASRWINLGFVSFQPSELLKIGTILMLAAYFAKYKTKLTTWRYGIGAFLLILAGPALLLLLQPDTGTLGVILLAAGAMYIAAGARARDVAILGGLGVALLGVLVALRPYVLARVMTFLNPVADQLHSGYQIKQSLIAIGSGELFGRGFGQSVQKFSYLPEPITDSIFAVVAEEFGFIGSMLIVSLFFAVALRGFWIASKAPDYFGGVLAVGIVTYIVGQAFVNIAAMLGVIPLTGIPLVFMSHGGSAMLVALGSIGILLSISRSARPSGALQGS